MYLFHPASAHGIYKGSGELVGVQQKDSSFRL